MDSRVCLMVLNYNDSETTKKLVSMAKDYSIFNYVLIIDNNSTDLSYKYLRELTSERIILIKTDCNRGYGAGNNYGARYAYEMLKCNIGVLSNPDVVFSEDTIKRCIDVLCSYSDTAAVAPTQLDINGQVIRDIAWKVPSALEYALMDTQIGDKIKKCRYSKDYFNNILCDVECVPGAFIVYDLDKFLEVGGYDENVFLYCEESIIGEKLKRLGYKTKLLTDCYYKHEHSVSINKSIRSILKRTKILFQSRKYFMTTYLNATIGELMLADSIQFLKKLKIVVKGE